MKSKNLYQYAFALLLCSLMSAFGQDGEYAEIGECPDKYNINEVVSKIQSGFPKQLKDCSVTLAKNMALAMSPFGKKAALKDPKAFMTECTIDGIKQKLPAGTEEYVKPVENFIQNILNAASAGGSLDVKKLSNVIGGMNVNELINELKKKAFNDPCAVNEPYESADDYGDGGEDEPYKGDRKIVSLGHRIGLNFSHLDAKTSYGYNSPNGSYDDPTLGLQFGLVLDIATSDWLHVQPGLMYIRKGAEDNWGDVLAFHYIEVPLLLSFKFSMLRINAGPYFGVCVDGGCNDFDIGLSTGFGFDIGISYIGIFYDLGFGKSYNNHKYRACNRTLGYNLGINL